MSETFENKRDDLVCELAVTYRMLQSAYGSRLLPSPIMVPSGEDAQASARRLFAAINEAKASLPVDLARRLSQASMNWIAAAAATTAYATGTADYGYEGARFNLTALRLELAAADHLLVQGR